MKFNNHVWLMAFEPGSCGRFQSRVTEGWRLFSGLVIQTEPGWRAECTGTTVGQDKKEGDKVWEC